MIVTTVSLTMTSHSNLTPEDLEALADEAERQNLSLACLIGAMEDGSPIAWMEKEERVTAAQK